MSQLAPNRPQAQPVQCITKDEHLSLPVRISQAILGQQVPVLTGIRGAAVLYVILYHFIPNTLSVTTGQPVLAIWDTFWLMGWSGVDLFFVLSGFLITGILFRAQGKPNYYKNFYVRRFLRIFPIYYLVLFASLVIAPWLTGVPRPDNSIFYWLYLSNFDTELGLAIHPVLVVAWSLSIEEQYYLVYPTIVRFLNYRVWLRVEIGLVLLSIAIRFIAHYLDIWEPRQFYHFTLAHFDGIALGGLLRLLVMRYEDNRGLLEKYVRYLPWIVVASLALNLFCGQIVLASIAEGRHAHISFQPPMYLIGYTLNALCYGGIIILCMSKDGLTFKFFNNPVLFEVGKVSYGMYLLQYPAKMLYMRFIPIANPWITAIGVTLTCYLMARVSWTIYEYPLLKLRDRLTKHEDAPAMAAA